MSFMAKQRVLAVLTLCALGLTVGATTASSDPGRGIDPNQGESLVEIDLASKAAATRLQLESESYGIDFNEHYLRHNDNGTVTVTVFGNEDELSALQAAGYDLGVTIEGPRTWEDRIADRRQDVRAENRADAAALDDPVGPASHEDEIVILRVDYFENYAGRFLSVEAKNRDGGSTPTGAVYTGPSMSLSWNTGAGTPIDTAPRPMGVNIDPDTTPDTYIEHRELVRIGDVGSGPPAPTRIRIGSSTERHDGSRRGHLAGRRAAADGPWLPEGLHDALHGPDRGLRALRRAGGRVPEHRRAHHAAAQDQRLPAQGAGQHERHAAPRQRARRRHTAEPDGGPHVPGLGPRGRQRHHRGVPQPERPELGAERERGGAGDRRQPRDQRVGGALEHSG